MIGNCYSRIQLNLISFLARGWSNIVIRRIGCFKDKPRRAAGSMVANQKGLKFAVRDCAHQARKRGYNIFAVQNGGECFLGPRAKITYNKYGRSTKCRGGKGGPWANDVYHLIIKRMWKNSVDLFLHTSFFVCLCCLFSVMCYLEPNFNFSFACFRWAAPKTKTETLPKTKTQTLPRTCSQALWKAWVDVVYFEFFMKGLYLNTRSPFLIRCQSDFVNQGLRIQFRRKQVQKKLI